jgi:hypothetical protein
MDFVCRGLPTNGGSPDAAWTFSSLEALDRYEPRWSTTVGRQGEMMPWLPVVVVAVVQIAVRSIRVVGLVWHERVSAKSRCDLMTTAAASGVALYERRPDGAALVIIPHHVATHEGGIGQWVTGSGEEAPR